MITYTRLGSHYTSSYNLCKYFDLADAKGNLTKLNADRLFCAYRNSMGDTRFKRDTRRGDTLWEDTTPDKALVYVIEPEMWLEYKPALPEQFTSGRLWYRGGPAYSIPAWYFAGAPFPNLQETIYLLRLRKATSMRLSRRQTEKWEREWEWEKDDHDIYLDDSWIEDKQLDALVQWYGIDVAEIEQEQREWAKQCPP